MLLRVLLVRLIVIQSFISKTQEVLNAFIRSPRSLRLDKLNSSTSLVVLRKGSFKSSFFFVSSPAYQYFVHSMVTRIECNVLD